MNTRKKESRDYFYSLYGIERGGRRIDLCIYSANSKGLKRERILKTGGGKGRGENLRLGGEKIKKKEIFFYLKITSLGGGGKGKEVKRNPAFF